MDENEKLEYIDRLTKVITECLTTHEETKHALLIVANDKTESVSLFAINAGEEILAPLVKSAVQIVAISTDSETSGTIH